MNNINTLPPVREMRNAYLRSDNSYDGIFYLAVRTTGVFCKPSCRVRKPKPENVEYYPSAKDAVFAGYRPCRKCHPMNSNGSSPEWLDRLMETIEKHPLERIRDYDIRKLGIDPARARRYFQKKFGMTFQAYSRGRRLGRSLEQIRLGANLDDVALGYGYNSHSGFRDAFMKKFGDPPGKSRDKECVTVAWIETPLGPMIAGSVKDGICLLEFTDRRMIDKQFERIRRYFRMPVVPGTGKYIEQLKKELTEYWEGKRKKFTVKLVYPGTDFQKKVWDALLNVPYGYTASYEDIAVKVGSPGAVRAVGTANGMNRIAVVIPCHRIINKSGKLGGYGGGLRRKEFLLNLEKQSL